MSDTAHSTDDRPFDLLLMAELPPFGATWHDFARAVRGGRARRLRRGVYVQEQVWTELSAREQYLLRLHAIARSRPSVPVFSHSSAAIIHGLPLVRDNSSHVHILAGEARSGRTRNGVVEHERPRAGDVVRRGGLLATTVARTVVDLAASSNALAAVAVGDAAIHEDRFRSRPPLTSKEELLLVWERLLPFRGHVRARRALEFADARAESPLESVSRLSIEQAGFPRPTLQLPLCDRAGSIGEVDFAWPELGIVGEADGEAKYLDATLRRGRSAERVVVDEKHREDRIRALGYRVVRWGWREATSPAILRERLSDAGLPVVARATPPAGYMPATSSWRA